MHRTLTDVRSRKANGDRGFTLIELLVVVVILGVLIAIAIPVYLNYRKGANDAAAESDIRNAISVLAVCNASDGKFPIQQPAVAFGDTAAPASIDACTGQKYSTSKGTTIKYLTNATGSCFTMVGTNAGGTKYWQYISTTGGSVAPSAVATYNSPPAC